jgi:hypothetical protein
MIHMPMSQEHMGDAQLMSFKELDQRSEPDWAPLNNRLARHRMTVLGITDLPRINQNSCLTGSHKICVGSLQLHVTWISPHYPYHVAAELCNGRKNRESGISSG